MTAFLYQLWQRCATYQPALHMWHEMMWQTQPVHNDDHLISNFLTKFWSSWFNHSIILFWLNNSLLGNKIFKILIPNDLTKKIYIVIVFEACALLFSHARGASPNFSSKQSKTKINRRVFLSKHNKLVLTFFFSKFGLRRWIESTDWKGF